MLVSSQDAKIAGWVCAGLSLVILIVRVIASRIKHGSFDTSSIVCFVAIVIVTARIVVNQYVLSFGTVNDKIFGKSEYFNSSDLRTLKIGSVLALIARLLVTTFYCKWPMDSAFADIGIFEQGH